MSSGSPAPGLRRISPTGYFHAWSYLPQFFLHVLGLKPLNAQGDSTGSPSALSDPPRISSEGHAKRILIADDSDLVRRVICTFLERLGYLVCGQAADGEEAITKAQELKPDLIVMDLAMPRMNGIEAASVIRATMPKMPIIAFTMYETLAKSMTSCLAITSVVSKPDGLIKLMQCIQSVLGPVS
jgi:CheY-like chemotaxis protein